jgi:hypothetical protein
MKKETELAALIVSWLVAQHWDVYQEVQFRQQGGVADIVAVRNGIMWIIETKTHYGLDVLQQAATWPVHYRSVGVPFSRDRDYRVARDYYQVGVIQVGKYTDEIREDVKPRLFIKNKDVVKRYLSQLTELHKTFAQAGSQSGHHLTPYKQSMRDIRNFIEANPGCTVKDIFGDLGSLHYSSAASFKGNIIKALAQFEPWCKIDTTTKPFKLFVRSESIDP